MVFVKMQTFHPAIPNFGKGIAKPDVIRWREAIYKQREQKFGVCQNVKISPTLGLQKAS